MLLYFITLQFGIQSYFRTRSDQRRVLYVACIACLFALYVAEFPQEAIGQITDMVLYYPFIAILIQMRKMDLEEEELFEKPIDINTPSLDFK